MIYYLLVCANVLSIFFIFVILYKKLHLPKSCFYREATLIIIISSIIDATVVIYTSSFILILFFSIFSLFMSTIGVILLRFYRDPKRQFYGKENIIISPADGRVIYIRKIEKSTIPISIKGKSSINLKDIVKTDILNTGYWLIGINMSILDVHVNRAPLAGEVILQKHYEGKFLSLKLSDSDIQNERNIIVIRSNNNLIGIIQIASRGVRRIKSFIKAGQIVKRGEKIGKIVFGSQVDIILPMEAELLISDGCQVYAGLTPIAKIS